MTKKERRNSEALDRVLSTKKVLGKLLDHAFKQELSEDLVLCAKAVDALAKVEELLRIRIGLTDGHSVDGQFVGHDHEED
jgi:hypothetical protein